VKAIAAAPFAAAILLAASSSGALTPEELRRDAVVQAVERSRPAVVNINAEEELVRRNPFRGFGDPFFDRFFSDFFDSSPPRRRRTRSLGSGVIIDPKGYILTNEHVVARTSRIRVTLSDERSFEAKMVGADPDHDLAVLKIESEDALPSIAVGTSSRLLIGEKVIAIGNPFGLSHTVTTGVVSATERSIRTSGGTVYYNFIQTDAAINPGNSGGPLLDITGNMIGINTAIYAQGQGIGFAIPADTARRIVDDLVRYGEVRPVWLGMAVGEKGGRSGKGSIVVTRLLRGGGGEKAGLKEGDVIVSVGRDAVRSVGEYRFRVGGYGDGEFVPLVVMRGEREIDFIVRAASPDIRAAEEMAWEWFGIRVDRDRHGLVVKKVRRGTPAAEIGLEPGDRLLEVENAEVGTREEFVEAFLPGGLRGKVLLLVQRGRYGYHITLKL
jgi:serine protease Do